MISNGFHGSTFGGGMLQTRVSYNVMKSINTKAFLNKVKINGKFLSNYDKLIICLRLITIQRIKKLPF